MGRAEPVETIERRAVAAREQHQQRRAIRLGRIGERPHRLQPLVQRAARIDHRDRRAGRGEARLGIVRPPRRDRPPAAALGKPVELVAMPERRG